MFGAVILLPVMAGISAADAAVAPTTGAPRPNIVVIMLDDVHPMDGRFFTPERTPNIHDSIIAQGVEFTGFYAETPLCCPARAGFLTGQHTHNHGVVDLDGRRFRPGTTIATELDSMGYHTVFIGKYLNEYSRFARRKRIPPGWDEFDAIFEKQGAYYDYRMIDVKGRIRRYGSAPRDYSTDVIADLAVERLRKAPADRPIFMLVNPFAIHRPLQAAPRHKADRRCSSIGAWSPPNFNERDVRDKPAWVRRLRHVRRSGLPLAKRCRMLLSVDDMVGGITRALDERGLLDETLLILTADNGMGYLEHRVLYKAVPYATRVPFYASWPSARGAERREEHTTLSNIDFAPTLCELAGCIMGPYPNGQERADGLSFAELLFDRPYPWLRDSILESQPVRSSGTRLKARPAWWAIRTTARHPDGLWHYVEYATGEKELYDVSNGPCHDWKPALGGDPCELRNVASGRPGASDDTAAIQVRLASQLAELRRERGKAPTPVEEGVIAR